MAGYDIFLDRLPRIDLHGYDRESARVAVDDFVRESVTLRNLKILIIHGIGSGIVKDTVHEVLARNRYVDSYKLDGFNLGCTIVNLKKNN